MKQLFVGTKIIPQLYNPMNRSFGIPHKGIMKWTLCRDSFAYWGEFKNFAYVCHSPKSGQPHSISDGASFLAEFENKLNLKYTNRSKFLSTQSQSIMWIRPGKFWRVSPVRMSLFTALIRCSDYYFLKDDNFEQALYSEKYTKDTRKAVQKFMAGYWYYLRENPGSSHGWTYLFSNISEKELGKTLSNRTPLLWRVIGRK